MSDDTKQPPPTREFLAELAARVRAVGWSVDNVELAKLVRHLAHESGFDPKYFDTTPDEDEEASGD